MSESIRRFFDQLSSDYTAAIDRCVPRYREMLAAVLGYLPEGFAPRKIVELGCGSGNLTEVLARAFPAAELHLVDISPKLQAECRSRLGESPLRIYHEVDFALVDFPGESIDLVTSTISLHHLDDGAKRGLFRRIHQWLAPGGWLSYSDQFSGATSEIYLKNMDAWHAEAIGLGSTDEDWRVWMEHQDQHDHHAPVCDQIDWLREAGFGVIDCPWRYLLWTVLVARK